MDAGKITCWGYAGHTARSDSMPLGIWFKVIRVNLSPKSQDHINGPVLLCHTGAHLVEKATSVFLPGAKTICGTQDRAAPIFRNLDPIACPKSKEQLVLRRLSVVLCGCPSVQSLN